MTSTEKALIEQYHRQGMGHTEIAARLNLSVNTVKSYWRRKKGDLRAGAVEPVSTESEHIISAVDPAIDTQAIGVLANTAANSITVPTDSPTVPDSATAPKLHRKKEAPGTFTIICKQCGATASTTRRDKEFCSGKCRRQWWYSHKGDSINATDHECPICGQHFRTPRKQTYCCHGCYIRGRFAVRAAFSAAAVSV
ncbi:MAG: sigma-70 family RNA polymerase sigma factor [Clostridia bacterium]|nr:sigma-70 family RNA polymerase sigma factor [Clostridia bacterium]MBQ8962837.1 sigma-70 family RNA polymerase sigma factor [Clostridia bacterium]